MKHLTGELLRRIMFKEKLPCLYIAVSVRGKGRDPGRKCTGSGIPPSPKKYTKLRNICNRKRAKRQEPNWDGNWDLRVQKEGSLDLVVSLH